MATPQPPPSGWSESYQSTQPEQAAPRNSGYYPPTYSAESYDMSTIATGTQMNQPTYGQPNQVAPINTGYYPPSNMGNYDTSNRVTGRPDLATNEAGGETTEGIDVGNSFGEKSIRMAFVRKVFGILTLQLLITAGIMSLFIFVEPVREYTAENAWVVIVCICLYIGLTLALAFANELRRKFPINLICLIILTVALACLLGSIASTYDASEILMAIGITVLVTLVMVGLGVQPWLDFTWLVGIVVILTTCLLGFGLCAIIFSSEVLYMFYACLGAILFSLWLLIDVQLIIGGKHKMAIDPEEYILAALNIYLDIVNILLFLLMILSKG